METDDDAITVMIANAKSGRNRTAVYSGRKTATFSQHEKFPSLIQLCVLVLQENVSRIDECGNLPYEMLKPILERGKPEDIVRIEDYNPRLMEDTGTHMATYSVKINLPKFRFIESLRHTAILKNLNFCTNSAKSKT